jgi:hypothetical protein
MANLAAAIEFSKRDIGPRSLPCCTIDRAKLNFLVVRSFHWRQLEVDAMVTMPALPV